MAFCIQASEITHHFYHVLWIEASPSMSWFEQVEHKPHFSTGEGSRNLQIWFKSANCDTSAQGTLPGYICIYKVTCCISQLLILVQEGSVLSLPILWGTAGERLHYLPPHFTCHFLLIVEESGAFSGCPRFLYSSIPFFPSPLSLSLLPPPLSFFVFPSPSFPPSTALIFSLFHQN